MAEQHEGYHKRAVSNGNVSPDSSRDIIDEAISKVELKLREINQTIFTNPELCYSEHIAHATLTTFLQSNPLTLTHPITVTPSSHNLSTAFRATYSPTNTSHPSIVFNAEYDALPNIGHACGHNLIAVSAVTAFLSLCSLLNSNPHLPGRITLLGCPAEEGGAGKVKLLEAGAYEGADVVLMGHPGPENWQGVDNNGKRYTGTAGHKTVARAALVADFWGREAHAGGMPWEGVNALDAVVGAYNMVAMMRQQIRPEERVHGCIWKSPNVYNVIPAHASVKYATRAPTFSGASSLLSRIKNCIDGAALGTGCRVEYEEQPPYLDTRLNDTLNTRYVANMALASSPMNESNILCRSEHIRHTSPDVMSASTDMGNVSYVVPSLHVFFGIECPEGVAGHHPSFTAASGTDAAFASAVRCGKGLALTGWDCLVDGDVLESVKEDFEKDRLVREASVVTVG